MQVNNPMPQSNLWSEDVFTVQAVRILRQAQTELNANNVSMRILLLIPQACTFSGDAWLPH